MTSTPHLWAIGYEDLGGAERARETISNLGWNSGDVAKYLVLEDIAVVVRHADGTFTIDRAPLSAIANITGCTAVGLLAGAVVAAPLIGAAIGALVGSIGTAIGAAAEHVDSEFIREVEQMMKPGTSALFMLDHQGDLEVILHTIQGLGGTVLKTNVSPELAQLIQSSLGTKPITTPGKPVEVAGGSEKM
jgi:uncharacterized membrane protein